MNKIKYYLMTAITVFGMLALIYTSALSSKNTLFISDAYDQYSILLAKLADVLAGRESFFYSFNGGLGFSFFGTFLYYLASPFNLLLLVIKDMNTFFMVTITLKLITAAITAFLFLDYHFKKENKIYTILFAVSYVFLTYNVRYFFNIMWLDAVYLLPLTLLGIDKILDKKKKLLFIVSLVLFIVTNYYLGYMACIFAFLYFNYRAILKYKVKEIFRENLRFITYILLCLLLAAFILIPVITYIPGYARDASLVKLNFDFNFNVLDFLKNFFIGSTHNLSVLNQKDFYLYMGLLPLSLLVLYFMNKEIPKKEKILTAIIILILFVSTAFGLANYIWHGFGAPQCFNGRFTFLFSFFLLFISFKSITKIKHIHLKNYVTAGLILSVLAFLISNGLTDFYLYCNILFIIAHLICLYFIHNSKIYMPILIITFVFIELIISSISALYSFPIVSKESVKQTNDIYIPVINYIHNSDDTKFYRIETNINEPYNRPIAYHYYGIDVFLSTLDNHTADFFIDIGYGSGSTKRNTISYYSGNEIIDSLFGVKYHLSFAEDEMFSSNYELLNSYSIEKDGKPSTVLVYENPYALALGYMVSEDILSISKKENALEYQNDIFSALTVKKQNIFTPIELTKKDDRYQFINSEQKPIYIYTRFDLSQLYDYYTVFLGYQSAINIADFDIAVAKNTYPLDDEDYISYSGLNQDSFKNAYASYYNHDNFVEIIDELKTNQLDITIFKDHYIKGNVTATSEKSLLFLTIPYDENWDVYVDGKKVGAVQTLDYLLGVKLEPGPHTIELKYRPKEIYFGLVVSLVTTGFIALFQLKKRFIR